MWLKGRGERHYDAPMSHDIGSRLLAEAEADKAKPKVFDHVLTLERRQLSAEPRRERHAVPQPV